MTREKQNRGFGAMAKDKQREIASKGGSSVEPAKRSFSMDRSLAQSAGVKGGTNLKGEQRSFSKNRELAAEAGRKGGLAKTTRRANQKEKQDGNESQG